MTCEYTSDGVIDVMEFSGSFDFWVLIFYYHYYFFPYKGYYGILLGYGCGCINFFIISVEGNSDFGGLLAKETLPGFGFLGYLC